MIKTETYNDKMLERETQTDSGDIKSETIKEY